MHAGGFCGKEGRTKKLAFLAYAISKHPVQVRADLQRYYCLNLDRLGSDFGAFHAAACLSCLPPGSALLSAIDKRLSWGNESHILHGIAQMLAGKEIPYPWDKKASGIDGVDVEGLPLDEFQAWYGQNEWKEVDGWQIQ